MEEQELLRSSMECVESLEEGGEHATEDDVQDDLLSSPEREGIWYVMDGVAEEQEALCSLLHGLFVATRRPRLSASAA